MRNLLNLLLSCVVLSAPAIAQQGDDCSNPMPVVGTGTFPFDATGATASALASGSACQFFTWDWIFTWDAPASGDYIIHANAAMDMALFDGSDCSAVQIECVLYTEGPIRASGLVGGATYLIEVGYFGATPGPGNLTIYALQPPPINDACSTATSISGFTSFPFDFTSGTDSGFNGGSPFCESAYMEWPPHGDIFFEWTATQAGDVRVELSSMNIAGALSIYSGSGCSATCLMPSNAAASGLYGSPVAVLRGVQPGDVYTFQVGHDQITSMPWIGFGDLVVGPAPPAISNDDCLTPAPISGYGTTVWDFAPATASFFAPGGPCLSNDAWDTNLDVFYVWTARADGVVQFDTIGTPIRHHLWVHEGDDCSATCVGSSVNTPNFPTAENIVQVNATLGDSYLIQIASWRPYDVSPGVLNINGPAFPPPNDTCATAIDMSGPFFFTSVFWNNSLATTSGFDGGDPVTCMSPSNPDGSALGQVHQDLFYKFTALPGVYYTITTDGSSEVTDTRISVFSGNDCNAPCFASADDPETGAGDLASLSFSTVNCSRPEEYLIQVGGAADTDIGDGRLEIYGIYLDWAITTMCSPANPHHEGDSVALCAAMGTSTPSGLHIEATGGPMSEFGFFLVATSATSSLALFNGVLCLDAPIGRYSNTVAANQGLPQLDSIGQFDANGVFQNLAGNATYSGGSGFDIPLALPFAPGGQAITPGDTYAFQLWYRDQVAVPGDSANFSDAIVVPF